VKQLNSSCFAKPRKKVAKSTLQRSVTLD